MSVKKSFLISVLIVLVIGICATTVASTAKQAVENEIVLEYEFSEPVVSAKAGYDLLQIEGLGTYERTGAPIVPMQPVRVLIPFGKKVVASRVTTLDTRQLPGTYRLAPAQKPCPLNYQGTVRPTEPDAAIYKSDSQWPGKYYEEIGTQSKRGYQVFILNLFPLQYIPAKGEISYASKLVLTVTLADAQKTAVLMPSDTVKAELAKSVDNPGALETYPVVGKQAPSAEERGSKLKGSGAALTLPAGVNYKYIVITSQALKNAPEPNFQTLCDARTAEGISATIVTTEWIYANYSGTRPDGGSDNQTKIRNFLIDAYNNWGTEYVLLGGAINIVPARMFWVDSLVLDDYDNPITDYMPVDMYYGCVEPGECSFDYNANGIYGQPGDGVNGGEVDLFAEIYVGRAPVENETEVTNFVRKTLTYNLSNGEYLSRIAMVAGHLGGCVVWNSADAMEQIRIGGCFPGAPYCTSGFENHSQSTFINFTTIGSIPGDPYCYWPLYDYYYPPDYYYWLGDKLLCLMNSGIHCFNHLGHCGPSCCMKLCTEDDQNSLANLTNTDYFFVYSQGCDAGRFDTPNCFAEVLTSMEHGAFGVVMNARFGWGNCDSIDGPSQRYARQFWDAPLGEGILEIGRANQDSKEDNAGDIGLVCMRWSYYELNLFGDPAQRFKFKRPIELTKADDVNDGNCIDPSGEITYTICYEPNISCDTNSYDNMSVVITDYLPDEVNYVSSEPYGTYDPDNHTVTWSINLPSDARGCVETVVTVKPTVTPGTTITNYCELTGNYFDANDSENTPVCVWCPIYVDADATGGNNGYSWKHAFTNLQDALEWARIYGCSEIRVAQGIYRPDSSSAQPNGTGDRQATFQLTNGIAIKGGYAGFGEPDPDARDIRTYETILSGDIGEFGSNSDNSYHVVTGSGTDNSAIIDGFTITAGNANDIEPQERGGGMYNSSGSPTIINCTFSGNLASFYGGGMYNGDNGSPTVANCIFSQNSADYYGGGMNNDHHSNPKVTNCTFTDNSAGIVGGGMANYMSNPKVINCTFTYNWVYSYGGGGMYNESSSPTVTNCILWDNMAPEYPQIGGGSPIVRYSDVQGDGFPAPGNIDADPLFTAPPDDLRLQMGSPCIDAGNNASLPADIADLDGDGDTTEQIPFDLEGVPRIIDGDENGQAVVDMGAFEYHQHYAVFATVSDGGSIEPAGEIIVNYGSDIEFTATANTGYEINTWYVDSSPVQTGSDTYTLTNITANHTMYVTFSRLQYTVTASADANGNIEPAGETIVYYDESKVFTATANRGYGVDTWYMDGNSVQTGGNTYTLANITANHTVYVTFLNLPQYTVTASTDANGSIAPAGAIVAYYGEDIEFTATGNRGYGVDTWYLDGNSVQTGNNNYTLTDINDNHTVYVTFFSLPQYTVTASAGANGTIAPAGETVVYYDEDIEFTATADAGYGVDTWYLDGNSVQTGNNTYTLTNITDNYTVYVTFSRLPYTVTATAGANGSIEPAGATVVYYGDDIVFTAAANPGYEVDTWYVDGNSVQTGGTTYTLTNITDNYTVYVTFSRLPYTVTASADVNGSIEPSGAIVVYYGDDIEFTATANSGYMVDTWYLDGNSVQQGGTTYTLHNVQADNNVLVTFTELPSAVYVDANSPNDPGTGTRDDPFRRLQDGIDAAQAGGLEVWVVGGTYKPTTGTDRTISFVMKQGVAVYGGFIGTETRREQREWFANPTILSGDIGIESDNSDNSYHVVTGANNSVLDGFIITAGSANGANDSEKRGGGMLNIGTSPMVSNCSFRENWAENNGGGMCNEYSGNTVVTNCTFSGNQAWYSGGGMYNNNSNVTITNCTFSGNEGYPGGGMYNYNSNVTVTNCILWEDFDPEIEYAGMPPTVSYCDIWGGWEGTGNISDYPLFVRNPGPFGSGDSGDLRLQADSPCIDAGYNNAVSADVLDLDGDGNTTEPIPFDLEGIDRITDGDLDGQTVVDMGAFEYNQRIKMPTFEPDGGGYRTDLRVIISCATAGATIHYTTNGLTPTEEDPVVESGGSVLITVEPATTLKARAFKDDWIPCDVKTAVYYRSFVRYVSTTGSDDNNGLSWDEAKRTVQAAINTAQADDEIWVAAGTYWPTTGTDRTISFVMKQDVAIYGGFAGTEASRDQRDWVANQTILSGNIGVPDNNSDNSYHVVIGVGGSTLDSFTITGGNANGGEPYGGGMRNGNGNPTITNCTFSGNTASNNGGGMYNDNYASPVITNCIFIGNSAGGSGGAMNNCWRGNPTVTNCKFIGNSAGSGGGMVNTLYSDAVVVTGCTFSGNTATNDGGGMYNYGGSGVFGATVTNCTFSGNSAIRGGGMLSGMYNAVTVTNCTFIGNSASNGGGMYTTFNSNPTMTNCVLWDNTAPSGPQIYNDNSNPTITYSDVQGGWAGAGNINADPLFVALPGDLRLQAGSPCIDAGNNDSIPPDYADLDGDGNTTEPIPFDLAANPRFIDDPYTVDTGAGTPPIVDMGAYERYVLEGDLNYDGQVNLYDFALFADNWLATGCEESNNWCGQTDRDKSGDVGLVDLAEILENWLECTSPECG